MDVGYIGQSMLELCTLSKAVYHSVLRTAWKAVYTEMGLKAINRLLHAQPDVRKYVQKLACSIILHTKCGWLASTTNPATVSVLKMIGPTIRRLSLQLYEPTSRYRKVKMSAFDNLRNLYVEGEGHLLLAFLLRNAFPALRELRLMLEFSEKFWSSTSDSSVIDSRQWQGLGKLALSVNAISDFTILPTLLQQLNPFVFSSDCLIELSMTLHRTTADPSSWQSAYDSFQGIAHRLTTLSLTNATTNRLLDQLDICRILRSCGRLLILDLYGIDCTNPAFIKALPRTLEELNLVDAYFDAEAFVAALAKDDFLPALKHLPRIEHDRLAPDLRSSLSWDWDRLQPLCFKAMRKRGTRWTAKEALLCLRQVNSRCILELTSD